MAVRRYLPGGEVRGLWADELAEPLLARGEVPRRASQVSVVEEGPQRGRFSVDFSPLGGGYRFCLRTTFARYAQAVAAERAWLTTHWILVAQRRRDGV